MKTGHLTSKITILIIVLIMAIISSNIYWGKKNHLKRLIEVDAKGYYAYLPALFIYHDLNFGFFEKIEQDKFQNKNFYDYRTAADGRIINKYYCGTALLEMPFFIIAHSFSHLLDLNTDGYSKIYYILIGIGALCYVFIGLYFLDLTLIHYKINTLQRAIVLITSVFGTHLFYYAVCEPGMSHVYSFAFISLFIYSAQQYFFSEHKKYMPLLALLWGIIILVRPINGLIIFILPFMAGNLTRLKQGFANAFKNKIYLLFCFLVFTGTMAVQLIYYKIATGEFFIYSYTNEHFYFFDPHIVAILFSYKKGLFLYTPVFLLSFAGCYFLWKSSRFQFYSWLTFFLIITYVFSCWWLWFYGGSFSSRVYVEYIPLFMILLAMALNQINLKWLFNSLIVILIIICQVQTYQYRYNIIHWSEMTKEKYWNIFLRIDKLIK